MQCRVWGGCGISLQTKFVAEDSLFIPETGQDQSLQSFRNSTKVAPTCRGGFFMLGA